MLSKQQVEQFHRDGFLVVRGMYNAAEMNDITQWTGGGCWRTRSAW